MPPASQHRVSAGTRDGGRFAPAAHTEPDVALPTARPGAAGASRFDTAGPARRAAAPAYRHDERYFRERREALAHLHTFVERDLVVVTDEQGRPHPGVVLRPHRSDGEYGSPESHTVPVSMGIGRYTFDVNAHRLALGELGLRRADPDERHGIRGQLEAARLDNVAVQRERVRDADRLLAEAGLPPVGSRVTVNWGDDQKARSPCTTSPRTANVPLSSGISCRAPAWCRWSALGPSVDRQASRPSDGVQPKIAGPSANRRPCLRFRRARTARHQTPTQSRVERRALRHRPVRHHPG